MAKLGCGPLRAACFTAAAFANADDLIITPRRVLSLLPNYAVHKVFTRGRAFWSELREQLVFTRMLNQSVLRVGAGTKNKLEAESCVWLVNYRLRF